MKKNKIIDKQQFKNIFDSKKGVYYYIFLLLLILFVFIIIYNKYSDKFDKTPILNIKIDPITNLDSYSMHIFKTNKDDYKSTKKEDVSISDTSHNKKGESKGEIVCKETVEKLFNKEFKKIRSNFLKNDVTSQNLELDMYNHDLKLAIEYNGKQHYEFIPYFHKNYEAFLNQKYRDEMKKVKCEKENIKLIIVPYYIKHNQIPSFIYKECKKLNLI